MDSKGLRGAAKQAWKDGTLMRHALMGREVSVGEAVVRDDVAGWCSEMCNKLRYGQCSLVRCMKRGGYTRGNPVDYSVATCEPLELHSVVAALPATIVERDQFKAGFEAATLTIENLGRELLAERALSQRLAEFARHKAECRMGIGYRGHGQRLKRIDNPCNCGRDDLVAQVTPEGPRYADTSCSQCGRSFGPGDHGHSHCDQHEGKAGKP